MKPKWEEEMKKGWGGNLSTKNNKKDKRKRAGLLEIQNKIAEINPNISINTINILGSPTL